MQESFGLPVQHPQRIFPLAELSPDESAAVYAVSDTCGIGKRLLDLGLTVQTRVSCVGRSPAGDPSAYRIRGAIIALRRCDSKSILVTDLQHEDSAWD